MNHPIKLNRGNPDTWSMDSYFLENINELIRIYIESDFNNNFESMYKALKNIESVASPKIGEGEIRKNLDWLRKNMNSVVITDEKGFVIGVNQKNKSSFQRVLDTTFKLLLGRLEEEGIYTRVTVDAKKAMSKFGGS